MLTEPKHNYSPIAAMGVWQCFPFSWTTLRGKHYRHLIAVTEVVDMFRQTDRVVG